MELRDFEYFAAIAAHGNIGRAAESLGLSQPALSKSLRRLETFAQVKLVNRTPKGIELTSAGTIMASQLGRLRSSLGDVMRAVADVSQGRVGHARIGAGAGIASQLLPSAAGALLKTAPDLTFKITVDTTEHLIPLLISGDLDLVITVISTRYENIVQEHLMDDEMAIVAGAHHRLAKAKRVRLADLAQQRWALAAVHRDAWQWMHKAFDDAGLTPPRIAAVCPTSLRLPIIASSDLLGFCPKRMLKQVARPLGLVSLTVPGMTWVRRIGLMYRKDAPLSPVTQQFVNTLRSVAGQSALKNKTHRN